MYSGPFARWIKDFRRPGCYRSPLSVRLIKWSWQVRALPNATLCRETTPSVHWERIKIKIRIGRYIRYPDYFKFNCIMLFYLHSKYIKGCNGKESTASLISPSNDTYSHISCFSQADVMQKGDWSVAMYLFYAPAATEGHSYRRRMQILPAYPPETHSTTQREGEQDESAQKEKVQSKGHVCRERSATTAQRRRSRCFSLGASHLYSVKCEASIVERLQGRSVKRLSMTLC